MLNIQPTIKVRVVQNLDKDKEKKEEKPKK